ncbi:uncharacterized protein CEXT_163111 [Caerostris extrusa]|uniref:Uncharacterized protein n=1 Tax=Caerostris extrusa TaxID=172846 RepID=A0AAV4YA68_CAEEX|nr:uncharacterized protein CEXT_163111 [Caerostris extrusa]
MLLFLLLDFFGTCFSILSLKTHAVTIFCKFFHTNLYLLQLLEIVTPAQAHPVEESPASFEGLEPRNLEHAQGTQAYSDYEEDTYRKLSAELCRKDKLHEAIKLDEDDSSFEPVLESDVRPSNLPDISSVVDSHIKSEILQEEIDQSIEESPLEHIRTEIFSQELGADIESSSPERKELGAFSAKKLDSPSDIPIEKSEEHEITIPTEFDIKDKLIDMDLGSQELHKTISPQISEESCEPTDDISSEGVIVEPDEHSVDYDEAKAEHSLTEQLQALASNSKKYLLSLCNR